MRRTSMATWVVAMLVGVVGLSGCGADPQTTPEPSPLPPPPEEEPEDPTEPAEPPAPAPADPSAEEVPVAGPRGFEAPVRAAWVHLFDDTLKTRAGIETMIDELTRARVDTLIAQPIRRHDAYYDSQVLPRTPDPAMANGTDLLAELLEVAHAADIAVHAWYSVAPTEHAVYDDLPAPAGWLTATRGRAAPEQDRWVTRDVDGTWSEYLEIALPPVQDHVARVATELAKRYPIDGVHLDYVRYPSSRHGYHPAALARYREATGTAGDPDPGDPAFVAWRQQQGTELVAGVRDALDGLDRPVALSAAVITWGDGPHGATAEAFAATRAATEALQDWPGWVEQDLVDAVLPMNYFREHDPEQAGWFTRWLAFEAALADAHDAAIVPGIGAWLNAPAAVVAQTRRAMETTDGAAIYSVQQPSDDETSRAVWDLLATEAWPSR